MRASLDAVSNWFIFTFGREIIEVSTFRSNQPDEQVQTNEKGMVIRDNVYGIWNKTPGDAILPSIRFTITLTMGLSIDYTGGFKDVKAKRIHMIGPSGHTLPGRSCSNAESHSFCC